MKSTHYLTIITLFACSSMPLAAMMSFNSRDEIYAPADEGCSVFRTAANNVNGQPAGSQTNNTQPAAAKPTIEKKKRGGKLKATALLAAKLTQLHEAEEVLRTAEAAQQAEALRYTDNCRVMLTPAESKVIEARKQVQQFTTELAAISAAQNTTKQ